MRRSSVADKPNVKVERRLSGFYGRRCGVQGCEDLATVTFEIARTLDPDKGIDDRGKADHQTLFRCEPHAETYAKKRGIEL
jgi:hypothetical protein